MPEASSSELLSYSIDELYEELGSLLLHGSVGFADEDPSQLRGFGEDWFKRNLDKIRSRVCLNPSIEGLVSDSGGEKSIGLVTVASEALGDLTDSKQTSLVLAFIVLRYGFKKLCAGYPPTE